jgi:two-component system sensor histidine kinase YesM
MLLLPAAVAAQDTIRKKKRDTPELKKAAKNLERSLIENDNRKIAQNYELLAEGLINKNDLAKAEEYLLKSLEIYTTLKDAAGKARVTRSIAQVQESQNKIPAAAQNYKAAEEVSVDKASEMLNSNDFNRLKNSGNPRLEDKYLNSNISILNKENKKEEVADAYIQQAEISLKKSDSTNALEKYRQALPYAKNVPDKAIKIYNEIAKLHISGKRFDDAIIVIRELLAKAKKINDYDTQISQLQDLASVYLEMNDTDKAVSTLKEAYHIASSNGKTFEARESLMQLIRFYKSAGDDQASLKMYEEFPE